MGYRTNKPPKSSHDFENWFSMFCTVVSITFFVDTRHLFDLSEVLSLLIPVFSATKLCDYVTHCHKSEAV